MPKKNTKTKKIKKNIAAKKPKKTVKITKKSVKVAKKQSSPKKLKPKPIKNKKVVNKKKKVVKKSEIVKKILPNTDILSLVLGSQNNIHYQIAPAVVPKVKSSEVTDIFDTIDSFKFEENAGGIFSKSKKSEIQNFNLINDSVFESISKPNQEVAYEYLNLAPISYKDLKANFIKRTKFSKVTDLFSSFKLNKNITEPTSDYTEVDDIFAKPAKFNFSNFSIPRYWYRQLAAFLIMLAIIITPLQAFTYYQDLVSTKDRVLFMTNEAIESLKLGQDSVKNFDLLGASGQFGDAKENFTSARKEISNLNNLTTDLLKILPNENKTLTSGVALLEAGALASEAGEILTKNFDNVLNNSNYQSYYNSLIVFRNNLSISIQKFNQAKNKINDVDPSSLPANQREKLNQVIKYLPVINDGLIQLYQATDLLLAVLGEKSEQKYLLVFVNSNELRATGGFMGSFAILDIDRGVIKNMNIPAGGTYDIQGQLIPKVISPEPLHLINPRWEFQDSNWWPDYPTSAKKMAWFYQSSNNPPVDGVITVSSNFMVKLLDIFGSVNMPQYNRVISKDNFIQETQKIVELEYDKKENRPKQFLSDLAPKILERVFNADRNQLTKLLENIKESLNQRQIMVYFNNQEVQKLIGDFGWDGKLRQTDGDFLSVVKSNIAGGKTDGIIKDTIQHQAEVQADGSIIDTVKIISRHNGISGQSVFTGVQNNSYIRFYVPLGSTLIDASGFKKPPENLFEKPKPEYQIDYDLLNNESKHETDEKTGTDVYMENGKTVFGNWTMLKAGATGEVMIKYRLPFTLTSQSQNAFYYSLLFQKQAGTENNELFSNLKLNDNLKILAKFPADITSEGNEISFHGNLITDQFYGAALINQ